MNEKYYVFDTKYRRFATDRIAGGRLTMIGCITTLVTILIYGIVATIYTSHEFGSYTEAMEAKWAYQENINYYDVSYTYSDMFHEMYDEWRTGIEMMFE